MLFGKNSAFAHAIDDRADLGLEEGAQLDDQLLHPIGEGVLVAVEVAAQQFKGHSCSPSLAPVVRARARSSLRWVPPSLRGETRGIRSPW
jgi:hypothetical protein